MSDVTVVDAFNQLAPFEQALVAVAVLLDGRDAERFLKTDVHRGGTLGAVASELGALHPELRVAIMGTSLRAAVQQLESAGRLSLDRLGTVPADK